MDSLEPPRTDDHHTFYLSSCESGAGNDLHNSNISSRRSSVLSNSSTNVDSSTVLSPVHSNAFLTVLKRLHCLKLRRKKHGRYRSLSSALHLFFKKQHHQSSIDISQSTCEFCKSPSSPNFPIPTIDNQQKNLSKKLNHSCQQLYVANTNKDRTLNSKINDFQTRRRIRHFDKTVSEDNNTNTLSSVDLAITPQLLPTLLTTETSSSVTPVPQITSFELKPVSDLFLITIV